VTVTASHDPRRALLEQKERRVRLEDRYGHPEQIAASDALASAMTALIPVDPAVTANDVCAFVYRDDEAADGWAESNRVHNGVPALAKVPLADGRVVGILDLRPAMQHAREERHEDGG
jgi:hypothetical protein